MRIIGKEVIPQFPSLVAVNQKMVDVFNLGAEGTVWSCSELVTKTSVVGGESPAANQPIENPAIKRCSIFPNFSSQIISRNMPKIVSVEISVREGFL